MKTHYLAHNRQTAVCGLRHPLNTSTSVEFVDCPSCLAWIDKNMAIRAKQIQKRRIPPGADLPRFNSKAGGNS